MNPPVHNVLEHDFEEMGFAPQPFRDVAQQGGGVDYQPAMGAPPGDDFAAERSPIEMRPLLLDDEQPGMWDSDNDNADDDDDDADDCDLCINGSGEDLGDSKLQPKLDLVMSLERLNYGYMRQRELVGVVVRERRKIEQFLALQRKPFKRWTRRMVARHYAGHGYNPRRVLGEDLRTCHLMKRRLRSRMVQYNRDTDEEELYGVAIDRFNKLCDTQTKLLAQYRAACAEETATVALNKGAAPQTSIPGTGWAKKAPLAVNKMASVRTVEIYEFSSARAQKLS